MGRSRAKQQRSLKTKRTENGTLYRYPKPTLPVRLTLTESTNIYKFSSLQAVVDHFQDYDLSKVKIEDDYDLCGQLVVEYPEPYEDYQRRVDLYNESLLKWEAWFEKNKEEILLSDAEKKLKEEQVVRDKIEIKKRVTERQIKKLEKQLLELKKEN